MLDRFFPCFPLLNVNCRSQVDPLRLPPKEYRNLDWRKLCWTSRLSWITLCCTCVFSVIQAFQTGHLSVNTLLFNPWFEGVFEHGEEEQRMQRLYLCWLPFSFLQSVRIALLAQNKKIGLFNSVLLRFPPFPSACSFRHKSFTNWFARDLPTFFWDYYTTGTQHWWSVV